MYYHQAAESCIKKETRMKNFYCKRIKETSSKTLVWNASNVDKFLKHNVTLIPIFRKFLIKFPKGKEQEKLYSGFSQSFRESL